MPRQADPASPRAPQAAAPASSSARCAAPGAAPPQSAQPPQSPQSPQPAPSTPAFIAPEPDAQKAVRGSQFVLKAGDAFVVSDALGDIAGRDDGLFVDDMRVLSQWRLTFGGRAPSLLSGRRARTTRRSPRT